MGGGERRDAGGGGGLFETRAARGGAVHKVLCLTILVGIVSVWAYRLIHIPRAGDSGRLAWIAMLCSELLFGFYWIISQSGRWRVVHRHPFKDTLSSRLNNLFLFPQKNVKDKGISHPNFPQICVGICFLQVQGEVAGGGCVCLHS